MGKKPTKDVKANRPSHIVTYSSENAPETMRWMAWIVLPDGSLWGIRFVGQTEQAAIDAAELLYNKEKTKARLQAGPKEPLLQTTVAGPRPPRTAPIPRVNGSESRTGQLRAIFKAKGREAAIAFGMEQGLSKNTVSIQMSRAQKEMSK